MQPFQKLFAACFAALLLSASHGSAETVLWSDDFESNAGTNWTTSSVWKIGSPTTGPVKNSAGFRTHSGTNCAATGLTTGAPTFAESRFICTNYNGSSTLLIPAANQYPRLRFWQWFDQFNSLGFIEIKLGTNSWQNISPTNIGWPYPSSSSGVWSRPSIDLSSFAGQSVQFAFHFQSGYNAGADPGWYIDEVAVVTNAVGNPPTLNNAEGFEGGLGDWAVDNGTWEVGVPSSGPATNASGFRAHSGTNCAGTVLSGNYGLYVDSRLISPPFAVPPSTNQVLRFWQWYSFVNAQSFVEVSTSLVNTNITAVTNITYYTNISTNIFIGYTNIVTYTNLIPFTNSIPYTNTTFGTNFVPISTNITTSISLSTNSWQTISRTNQSYGNSAIASGGWTNTMVDLSAYAGKTVRVAFHFQSGGSGYATAAGWYVDDISIGSTNITTSPTLLALTNFFSGKKFQFGFTTQSNTTWRVDASTNLSTWKPVFTNSAPDGVFQFSDAAATNFQRRFYRAVSQ